MIMYDEVEYARSRLLDTVVRLKDGQPIRVSSMYEEDGKEYCEYVNLLEDEAGIATFDELDITPVPLGYCNYNGRAYYLTRMPMRRDWKQGLRRQNISTSTGRNIDIPYEVLAKTIVNRFPSVSDVLDKFVDKPLNPFIEQQKALKVAFSRNFAILLNGDLEYKGSFKVGSINRDGYTLHEERSWVEDELKLSLGA